MIFGLAGIVMSILAWRCVRDPKINFLAADDRASWIVFPTAADATLHRFASIDTTFRREFILNNLPPAARLSIRAARRAEVKINGRPVEIDANRNWKNVSSVNVQAFLQTGRNLIEARVFNHTGPPALSLVFDSNQLTFGSDQAWEASIAGSAWRHAVPASTPKISGPGNPIAGGEQTFRSSAKIWPIWIVFAAIGAVTWVATGLGPIRQRSTAPWLQNAVLVFVVGVWLILFWNNARLLPYHAGFDSQDHLAYIKYIQENRALPLPNQGYEMYQPPLYYAISAATLSVCGLSVDDPASVIVLRFLTTLFAIAQFTFVFLSLRFLIPNRIGLQLVGLTLAAFLPMQLYLSHYVTNEMLAAALMTAAIYLCLRLLQDENASLFHYAGLGLCIGAAMLTKATGILLLPVVVAAVAGRLVAQRAMLPTWLRNVGVMLAVCFAVCGWHYLRIWLRFGTPLLGNWDVASGFAWWQEPGYHTVADYFRFGRSLVRPLFSGFAGIGDGIYSTLWGDGLCGGAAGLAYRPPWNYQLMVAGYLLGLVPAVAILTGAITAAAGYIRKPSAELFLLLGLSSAVAFGLIFMTLRVPSYAQAKAFYGLSILGPLCFFGVLGWERLTRGRTMLRVGLGLFLAVWAMNSFASVWMVRSTQQRLYLVRGLRADGKIDLAASEAAKAVQSNPSNSEARQVHALILDDVNKNAEAIIEAERAVALSPEDSAAHLQLAMTLKGGQKERAISEARQAIELGPENSAAYKFLMSCLLEAHRNEEAIHLAEQWLTITPFNADVHYALALTRGENGDLTQAANQFGYVMALRPDLDEAHSKLRHTLLFLATAPNGPMELHAVAAQAPDSPRMLDELAWLLATHPDPKVRDGQEATRLAERANVLTDRQVPALLDTLAAAYAEAGKFPAAVSTAEEALTLARSTGDTDGGTLSEKILATVRQHQPYREEPVGE